MDTLLTLEKHVTAPFLKQRSTPLPTAKIFLCSESECVLMFKAEADADAHMDSRKHIRELESKSLYDTTRKKCKLASTSAFRS